ncbi:hypothetical protein HK414_13480 [Ramlibacter terrae]|uniref:Uncharacterized protein n=1 Tax=Ramlibacter terrae TaxID=2732511 RepID=A0ABX6P2Y9_9BURK|nr:hypothetical protein HK414_13480 [Ramlibacter terrae]
MLIGRPLEVLLPVTLDAPDSDNACSVGELFYGDTRVNVAPEIRWLPGPDGREGTLRISSASPVNEPTVTLNLRVGCGLNVTSRRFVLLPDLPRTADAAPLFPGQRPAAPPVAAAAPAPAPGAAASARAPAPARPAPGRVPTTPPRRPLRRPLPPRPGPRAATAAARPRRRRPPLPLPRPRPHPACASRRSNSGRNATRCCTSRPN